MNHQWKRRAPPFPLSMEANNPVKGANGQMYICGGIQLQKAILSINKS